MISNMETEHDRIYINRFRSTDTNMATG